MGNLEKHKKNEVSFLLLHSAAHNIVSYVNEWAFHACLTPESWFGRLILRYQYDPSGAEMHTNPSLDGEGKLQTRKRARSSARVPGNGRVIDPARASSSTTGDVLVYMSILSAVKFGLL